MFCKNFQFYEGMAKEDTIGVKATDLYSPEKGYGFVTEENRKKQPLLKLLELTSGFDTPYWYQEEAITVIKEDENGCYLDSDAMIGELEEKNEEKMKGEKRWIPLTFRLDVPKQGNYKVTFHMKAKKDMSEVLIFTGRRRLAYRGAVLKDKEFVFSFVMNVCDIVPRGKTKRYEDKALDITIVASNPSFRFLEIEEIESPTVYIAGDSTVTDQPGDYPYAPGTSYSGWGQMLSAYLKGEVAVSNHAHSGLTTESFREEGHHAIVQDFWKKGDYCLFQFAHNDQKLPHLQAHNGYRDNLVRYVEECRKAGVYPVIITPLARNTWKGDDGSYNDLLKDHANACLELGEELNVPVADLHKLSMDFVKRTGLEAAKSYYFPNDYTHTNDYGAYLMAGFVAEEIVRACDGRAEYLALTEAITKGYGEWEAAKEIVVPDKPKRFENMENPCPPEELLADIDELEEAADRVAVLYMVTKTARLVPVNVYNDMYEDVTGHEWYAGTVESAYQNGIIQPELVEGNQLKPLQKATWEEFLVFAMRGYKTKKPFPNEQECIYDAGCREFAKPFVRAAYSLSFLPKDGSIKLSDYVKRGETVAFCRGMNI